MEFRTNDNVRIHFTDTAEVEKQAIIFIPGIGGSGRLFDRAVELFKDQYRVIVMDPRNQGGSERTFKGQTIARHGMDLAELISHLNLDRVILVGNSMGAGIMWSYLSLFTDNQVAAMVDLDQSPKMVKDDTWTYGFKDLTWDLYPEYLRLDMGRAYYHPIASELKKAAKDDYMKHPYIAEDNFDLLRNHAEHDWRELLSTLTIPVLILAGEKSPYFNPDFADKVADLSDNIFAQVIPDCGHIIQAEQPELMHEAIINFLTKQNI
ncbi:pimeloyl-ACP methyl ester carboxylesterase [Lactobacillus colini]|uniref:Pimeloyl-ACP methyl ester carboxylesterase n=1 Tax=Lactobacillus colini TaxID=1819254 RepID=A0ABS4ME73_9LACO|nr:alpha/beta hydrolase [Lactobacillus colini]MBP2057677.1 pimeloyl-ACP methyl ester carboxylesterase [Lactobacillus colini]